MPGLWESIVLLGVFLLTIGVPVAGIVGLVLFLNRRKNSSAGMKKCGSCAYSILVAIMPVPVVL